MKITSPVQGLNDRTAIGPVTLEFKDSVAEVDDLPDGVVAYLKENGYGIDGSTAKGRDYKLGQADPADPRKVSTEQVGTKIRDAAVDPHDTDFLAPTNAGKANPHGTDVVSPGIHANEGIRPIKAGEVHVDDPAEQDAAETAHAVAATDGTPVVLTEEEQELLGVDAHGRPTDPDSVQIVGDPDDVDPDDLADPDGDPVGDPDSESTGDPDSESTGDPQPAPADAETEPEELKGQALTDALKEAGLPVSGSADEKRQRLAEHRAQV